MSETTKPSVVVIGAGPAGLIAADMLSAEGFPVVIYERMPSPARKLLMAGRGGLNITHSEAAERFDMRYGLPPPRLAKALAAFNPEALIEWVHGLGQETFVGSSGRVFPKAMKSSPLVRALMSRLAERGVEMKARHTWTGFGHDGALMFDTPDGALGVAAPSATLLALGGASWPRLGSTGAWVKPLGAAGVAIQPLAASNAGVRIPWSPFLIQRYAGAPLKRITLNIAGVVSTGEAVLTKGGLEGGAVYALSRAIRDALAGGQGAAMTIDLRPDLSEPALTRRLAMPRGKQSMANVLRKAAGLAAVEIAMLREPWIGKLPDEPDVLARLIKAFPVHIDGLAGLDRAISTAGGVSFDGIEDNGMLAALPGIFVAGEMLDWDAPTGGYLLQASFATGVLAARDMAGWVRSGG